MTTLLGNELIEYLDNLKSKVRNLYSDEKEDMESMLHSQMFELIDSEKNLIKYFQLNGHKNYGLAFSGNGLFSVESLKADLETMCKLAEEKPEFKDISERYKKGVKKPEDNELNSFPAPLYREVSKEEWNSQKEFYEEKEIDSQLEFDFNETKEGKFELLLKQEFYFKGIDDNSKRFPVLTREGNREYEISWNQIFSRGNEKFSVLEKGLVLSENKNLEICKEARKKTFEGITNFSYETLKRISFFIASPIILPTSVRKEMYFEESVPTDGFLPLFTTIGGVVSGLFGVIVSLKEGPWEIAPTILAANTISGIYEYYRKNKLNLIEDKQKNNLQLKETN